MTGWAWYVNDVVGCKYDKWSYMTLQGLYAFHTSEIYLHAAKRLAVF